MDCAAGGQGMLKLSSLGRDHVDTNNDLNFRPCPARSYAGLLQCLKDTHWRCNGVWAGPTKLCVRGGVSRARAVRCCGAGPHSRP